MRYIARTNNSPTLGLKVYAEVSVRILVGSFAIASLVFAGIASADSGSSQAQASELSAMAGIFSGKMHLNQSNQDFDCRMVLDVVAESSDSILVPKIAGKMSFPRS